MDILTSQIIKLFLQLNTWAHPTIPPQQWSTFTIPVLPEILAVKLMIHCQLLFELSCPSPQILKVLDHEAVHLHHFNTDMIIFTNFPLMKLFSIKKKGGLDLLNGEGMRERNQRLFLGFLYNLSRQLKVPYLR